MPQLTWLITGCSSGLGEVFVRNILARGDRVIATARNGTERLASLKEAGAAVLDLDVTAAQDEIDRKITEAVSIYEGGIDVLVNNAGYIEAGMVEEISHERFVQQLNTNLLGVVDTTRAILPHFRAKKSGVVVFLGSSGGVAGEPGAGAYCASKFALEGVFECLRQETTSFGIQSVLFQLGFFRTKIMDPANIKAQGDPASAIADYTELNTIIGGFVGQMNGNQPGDPEKAVKIMIDVVKGEGVAEGKEIPERLPLGPDVLGKIRDKYTKYLEFCTEWENVIASTDIEGDDKGSMRTVVKLE
ncbi:hypothetical protein G7Y89_g12021 [Cudoniella acicularis]|uniref:Uncharacterized protein n=1 Tax=Cudoniella acicularis TaxID=354080 RepID=A0A8H4VXR9_9HELO|nr:hypothetical protein G7Y89_g12021 [Cudoniella acicularis]